MEFENLSGYGRMQFLKDHSIKGVKVQVERLKPKVIYFVVVFLL